MRILYYSLAALCAFDGAVDAAALTVSIPNFRDVGGKPTADGRVIRKGVIYRSASPANASEADSAALQSIGVRVLDLRGSKDALKDNGPRLLADSTTFLPLLTESMMRTALVKRAREDGMKTFSKVFGLSVSKKLSPSRRLRRYLSGELDLMLAGLLDLVSLLDLYKLIIDKRPTQLREAVEMCATGDSLPMLVHCTHGKDRTGVLVAIILLACGVPEEEVINDYASSHEWGCSPEGKWAMRQALPESVRQHVDQSVLDDWCEAPNAVLEQLFELLREEYGSLEAYLDSIGIDEALRARLREQLTVPADAAE